MLSVAECLQALAAAAANADISPTAAENMRRWLTDANYREFLPELTRQISERQWQTLDDVFWTVIPFGTAGRRGRMYPIGCNAINDRTIGESAQGLAEELVGQAEGAQPRCAIAYDTRHRSRQFAELCAEVLVAGGVRVFFLDGPRATPELSFTVRELKCQAGIMVSASHNPPSDNAVKVFGANGGQIRAPLDAAVMQRVAQVTVIRRASFSAALTAGMIVTCQAEMDDRYRAAVLSQSFPGPRDLRILYSPLHGVGMTSVFPVLQADGFQDIAVYAPHATPDGDFPNVPNHSANPENPAVFVAPIAAARESGADLVLASDPDADRIGCACPLSPQGPWQTLSGNQIAVLLADYLLRHRKALSRLSPEHYLVKTYVTTDMLRRLASHYGVLTCGDVPTGFKWISSIVDERGPERFVLGCEEAHGYMVGNYVRDKDGAVAAMLLAELAAQLKAQGRTLHQELDRLYSLVGYHAERTWAITIPGAQGMAAMQAIMAALRTAPPRQIAGCQVIAVRDLGRQKIVDRRGERALPGPQADLIFLDFEQPGNYLAVRPSGTEPKLKFYLFAYRPAEQSNQLDAVRAQVSQQMDEIEAGVRAWVAGTGAIKE